jgi:hypothetical protein
VILAGGGIIVTDTEIPSDENCQWSIDGTMINSDAQTIKLTIEVLGASAGFGELQIIRYFQHEDDLIHYSEMTLS